MQTKIEKEKKKTMERRGGSRFFLSLEREWERERKGKKEKEEVTFVVFGGRGIYRREV